MGINAREESVVKNTVWETHHFATPVKNTVWESTPYGVINIYKGEGEGGPAGLPGAPGAPGTFHSIVHTVPLQTVCGRLARRLMTMGAFARRPLTAGPLMGRLHASAPISAACKQRSVQ